MKQVCLVASDYLGLEEKESLTSWDKEGKCGYWDSKQPQVCGEVVENPTRVCGNCVYYVVVNGFTSYRIKY